jgi:hypothetical protein
MNITDEQKEQLAKYDIAITSDIDTLLLDLDDKITEIGFNADYSLNKTGAKLQRLYDELYSQN